MENNEVGLFWKFERNWKIMETLNKERAAGFVSVMKI